MSARVSPSDVTAGEHVFRLHRAGEGNPEAILFLHGSGPGATGMSNFSGTIEAFSADYDCLVVDLVGFGDSSHPHDASPLGRSQQNAVALLDLLDTLGLERVHLVGNSLGGAIALRLLTLAPQRFGRAVCMGTAGAGSFTGPSQEMLRLITFYDDPTPRAMAELISFMLYDPAFFADRLAAIAEERLAAALRPEVRRSHKVTFTMAPGRGTGLPETALHRIPNEVLFVHGREDVIAPVESSQWYVRQVPRSTLAVLPHCGHWAQIEQAQKFNAVARAFLSGQF